MMSDEVRKAIDSLYVMQLQTWDLVSELATNGSPIKYTDYMMFRREVDGAKKVFGQAQKALYNEELKHITPEEAQVIIDTVRWAIKDSHWEQAEMLYQLSLRLAKLIHKEDKPDGSGV